MKKYFRFVWPFVLVLVLSSWAIQPLFHSGFFPMHDDEQIARLFEMVKVLAQGQFPPRWVPDLGFGYGYPLFNFYPPFVYYLGAFFHMVGFSYINSTKFVMGAGFIFSAWFMYLWVKNRFGKLPGLFAVFLYTYIPYHAVDLYVRGALSDFFSFVWIPAVFWSLDRVVKKPTKLNFVLSSILLSLVVLTHTLLTLQFFPFLILYMGYLLFEDRQIFKKLLGFFTGIGLLGFGLSAYFAIPSVLEKHFTLVDTILTRELANYAIHFVCPMQLWNSPWGYGGSIAGCVDGLSFQAGKVQILLVIISVLLSSFFIFIKKSKKHIFPLFISILFIGSLLLTTQWSSFIWNSFQPLSYVQFPWRFLLFAAIFSSLLGGYFISIIQRKFSIKIAVAIVLILTVGNFYLVYKDFHPQTYLKFNDNKYIENNDIQWRVSGMSYEYVPKQVSTRLSNLGTTQLALDEKDIPKKSITVISGIMQVNLEKDIAVEKHMTVIVQKEGILQINTYSFPGWKVFVDGKQIEYRDKNKFHLIQIPLTSGVHNVKVVFTNTTIRTISNLISLFSLLSLVVLLIWNKKIKV